MTPTKPPHVPPPFRPQPGRHAACPPTPLAAQARMRLGGAPATHPPVPPPVFRPKPVQRVSATRPSIAPPAYRPPAVQMHPARVVQRAEVSTAVPLTSFTFNVRRGHVDFLDKTKTIVKAGTSMSAMTMHHKVSQANLKRLNNVLAAVAKYGGTSQKEAAAAVLTTAQDYLKSQGIQSTSAFHVLNNMPLNIAYGPTDRWHHMGDKFDPSVDTTSDRDDARTGAYPTGTKFVGKDNPPKLQRRLSTRSIELKSVDDLISAMPTDASRLMTYASGDEVAPALRNVDAALKRAIAADQSAGKNPFYDARQWEKVGAKYLRSPTPALWETYDPSQKPTISTREINKTKQLTTDQGKFKRTPSAVGTRQIVRGYIYKFDTAVSTASQFYSEAEVREQYQDWIAAVQILRDSIGATKPLTFAKKIYEPIAWEQLDDAVESAYNDLMFVTSG